MKKKVLALMLVIPIIFILAIYSSTQFAVINVDIPVASIEIKNKTDGLLEIDIAEGKQVNLNVEIQPALAKNKGYKTTVTPLNAGVFGNKPGNLQNAGADVTDVKNADTFTNAASDDVVSVDENGNVTPTSPGKAKVTVTSNDGAFTDSVTVVVVSTKPLDFTPGLIDEDGDEIVLTPVENYEYSYEIGLKTGQNVGFYSHIYPASLSNSLVKWTSSTDDKSSAEEYSAAVNGGKSVVVIDELSGAAKTYFSGESIITATLDDGAHGIVEKKIKVTVVKAAGGSGLLVNGKGADSANKIKVEGLTGDEEIAFTVEKTAARGGKVVLKSVNGAPYSGTTDGITFTSASADGSDTRYNAALSCPSGFDGTLELVLGVEGSDETQSVSLVFGDYTFDVRTGYDVTASDGILQKFGFAVNYFAESGYDADGVEFEWYADGNTISITSGNGRLQTISALAEGIASVTVTAKRDGVTLSQKAFPLTVVADVSAMAFGENADGHGIAEEFVIGGYTYKNGVNTADNYKLNLVLRKNGKFVPYDGRDVEIYSSDKRILSVCADGNGLKLVVNSDGTAVVAVKWKYAGYFKDNVSETINVRGIRNAVNVSDYKSLKAVTEAGRETVLQSDVMLGEKGMTAEELKKEVRTFGTDYDWRYLRNYARYEYGKEHNGDVPPAGYGNDKRPEIMYIIEFKADVYGNGHELNAEYIAAARDRTGTPLLFKGPADFVAMPTAAVKGQDNVSFLVRTDGVAIDNVSLKSCSDDSLIVNGKMDLSRLNYVGTTLEIAGDATIKNCRVSNGRTAVRIFGGNSDENGNAVVDAADEVNADEERVTTRIESSILSNAREFILKIGTNRAIAAKGNCNKGGACKDPDHDADHVQFNVPSLMRADGTPYNQFEDNLDNASDPSADDYLDDLYFYKHYLLTDVTLKNCALYNSGLFTIGLDTHFSGTMLNGISDTDVFKFPGWSELAATSFATVLRFEGDVKLLDWKKLSDVDSSTLIQVSPGAPEAYLKFDIPKMLKKVSSVGGAGYENLMAHINGEAYIHGGIACFGGGKNYAALDLSGYTGEIFSDYKANISILAEGEPPFSLLNLQGTLIPQAAGVEDFRFYIYDAASAFTYQKQQQMLSDGSAFDWI